MGSSRRSFTRILGAVALLAAVPAALAQPAAAADPPSSCQVLSIPVSLDLLLPATVKAQLCLPADPTPATVQLLVHGGTYNRTYWDFPYQPEHYSYVRAATAAGYATLAIDRVGYGQSTRPPGALLTGLAHAGIVHQIVGKLRRGAIGGVAFPKVVLVGHSLGSATSVLESSTYHDVQGVVLTGFTHHIAADALLAAFTQYTHPALLDPQFAGLLDPVYLTTVPGKREVMFYAPGDHDPALIARDEETKDLVSSTELGDFLALGFTAPTTLAITVPVLVAVGGEDGLFCRGIAASDCSSAAALRTQELPYFAPQACLRTDVLPGAGHDVNLTLDTAIHRAAVLHWIDTFVGLGAGSAGPCA
jgi:pimeloyl-ACP methyl ester carboxylesterase